MGNYATQADLKGRYENDVAVAHLTLDEESGVPDPAILDEVIDNAEGEVNSYLAQRYLVPVDVVTIGDATLTARLRSITLDLATVNLELRTGDLTDVRQKMWDNALAWLDKVSKGEVLLPATVPPIASTSRASVSRFGTAGTSNSSNRLFSRATQEKL